MNLDAIALAAMLRLADPVGAIGSRIPLADKPVHSELEEGVTAAAPGFKFMRASWDCWTRTETRDEALERWATIAMAVDRVAQDPPREWTWRSGTGPLQLVRAVVTIMRHESGEFWRSVHEGKLRGKLGEVCVMQERPPIVRALGYDPESLVGIDAESTERCIRVGVIILAKSRHLAEHRCPMAPHWFGASVAAYGSGNGCDPCPGTEWAKGVSERVSTYALTGMRRPLPTDAVGWLGGVR